MSSTFQDRMHEENMSQQNAGLSEGGGMSGCSPDTPLNPSHYSRWAIEPWDFIQANNLDFFRGNIIKYIMRHDRKNGLEDLRKARVYLDRMIADAEAGNGR